MVACLFPVRRRQIEKGRRAAVGRGALPPGRRARLRLLAAAQCCQQSLHRRRVEIRVEVVVDLDHRRIGAGAQALDLHHGELAVGGHFLEADAELALAGVAEIIGAAQPAGGGPADLDQVAPHRLQIQHAVETGDLVDADRRHVEDRGHMVHRRPGQPAASLGLGEFEQRQDRARLPARRVFGDELLGHRLVLGCEGEALAHRSISPKTMSMEPRIATESASIWPRLR